MEFMAAFAFCLSLGQPVETCPSVQSWPHKTEEVCLEKMQSMISLYKAAGKVIKEDKCEPILYEGGKSCVSYSKTRSPDDYEGLQLICEEVS